MGFFIRMPRPTEAKQFTEENVMEVLTWLTDKGYHAAVVPAQGTVPMFMIINPGRPGSRNVPVNCWIAFDRDAVPSMRVMTPEIFHSQYAPT